MILLFKARTGSERRKNAMLELMVEARAILGADDDTLVSVSEHDCGAPECGGTRTIVLIMRPGQPTEAVRLDKSPETVTRADLWDALAPLIDRSETPPRARME